MANTINDLNDKMDQSAERTLLPQLCNLTDMLGQMYNFVIEIEKLGYQTSELRNDLINAQASSSNLEEKLMYHISKSKTKKNENKQKGKTERE